MTKKVIIKTNKVSRDFTSGGNVINAVKTASISIEQAKLVIFKGRSGSGKTTLMNILGGLDLPTSGEVFFGDVDITKLSDNKRDEIRRKNIGFIFQSVALISQMTAYENVDFNLRVTQYPKEQRHERVLECLHLVGLSERIKHTPPQLSGGEQQRVAIARAISHKPKIIFADEPTAELDTHLGLQVIKLFKELIDKEGISVIMTTHDENMIQLADYVYVLQDGEIVDEIHEDSKEMDK